MRELQLTFEELLDLWRVLKDLAKGSSEGKYPRIFEMLGAIETLRESYRVEFPKDPGLMTFIASCRQVQKEKNETARKERIHKLKADNPQHVALLKKYNKDFQDKHSESRVLKFQPLDEFDLPENVTPQQKSVIKSLITSI